MVVKTAFLFTSAWTTEFFPLLNRVSVKKIPSNHLCFNRTQIHIIIYIMQLFFKCPFGLFPWAVHCFDNVQPLEHL